MWASWGLVSLPATLTLDSWFWLIDQHVLVEEPLAARSAHGDYFYTLGAHSEESQFSSTEPARNAPAISEKLVNGERNQIGGIAFRRPQDWVPILISKLSREGSNEHKSEDRADLDGDRHLAFSSPQ
ncbi:hypothetical protein Y1Q_0005454 [Alligator mississippiensis]|uniref:Uncharacterized protein n=1 Tax=Alligator mississippiensis TaxID=8496 RepID=A0A151MEJ0_ALLMI|nr:hypothetical protein Y1Q_0005454 [Alligator mississippiensis]